MRDIYPPTKVCDLAHNSNGARRLLLEQNIARRQVAVDDVLAVDVDHAPGNIHQYREDEVHVRRLGVLLVEELVPQGVLEARIAVLLHKVELPVSVGPFINGHSAQPNLAVHIAHRRDIIVVGRHNILVHDRGADGGFKHSSLLRVRRFLLCARPSPCGPRSGLFAEEDRLDSNLEVSPPSAID